MSPSAWSSDVVSSDGSGLNTAALLSGFQSSSGLTNLTPAEKQIFAATLEATIWSYPLNETYRYYNLDTVAQAAPNKLFKPEFAASWLNENSAPAPNASLLYMTAWLDLSADGTNSSGDLVLQLPANPDGHYYMLAILDSYINTVGSFGPRDPLAGATSAPQFVLLAGPNSTHYGTATSATITDNNGQQTTMPVLQVDTPRAWITARINTNTLDANTMATTRAFINGTEETSGSGFQLTTLEEFQANGTVPYSPPITQSASSDDPKVIAARQAYESAPTTGQSPASAFFTQVAEALALNPVPSELSTDRSDSPPPYQIWIGNQNSLQNADTAYQPPSALAPEQLALLNRKFGTIGLNLSSGFSQPTSWTDQEQTVFNQSYLYALNLLSNATSTLVKGKKGSNNGWHITNDNVGVYPNTWSSWLVRAGAAIEGGAANIPNDAVYPTTEIDSQGNTLTSTYTYRIALPKQTSTTDPSPVEAYAPAQGFWAYTIYQPNPGNSYQPFLIENAIRNTTYSPINSTATLTENGTLKTATPDNWNAGTAKGTALVTGTGLGVDGLADNTIYYVETATEIDNGDNLLLTLSADYQPKYSSNGIPIGGAGSPGAAVTLSGPAGSSLAFGWINPVAQLGSNQLKGISRSATTLQTESDGSIHLNLSSLAPGNNPENWLPTPLVTGSGSSDPKAASQFQVMARYYWPTTTTPSILAKSTPELYQPPGVQRLGLNRLHTWDLLSSDAETQVKHSDPSFGSTSPLDTPSPFSSDVVGALIDLRVLPDALAGKKASVHYSYTRNSNTKNQLFFYAIDDITGTINGHAPSDAGYLSEAWSQRLQADTPIEANVNGTSQGAIQLIAGKLYAPIVKDGQGQMFTAFDSANSGDYRHFDLLNGSSFAFEDLSNGGTAHDRDDGLFTITSIDL